jgi:hypothetical protein
MVRVCHHPTTSGALSTQRAQKVPARFLLCVAKKIEEFQIACDYHAAFPAVAAHLIAEEMTVQGTQYICPPNHGCVNDMVVVWIRGYNARSGSGEDGF